MNERIAQLRKNAKMSQRELSEVLNVSRNYLSLVETGDRNPSDRTVMDICRVFNANEGWLRTGEGEPYKQLSKKEMLTDFFADVLNEDDGSFKAQFIEVLAQLDEEDWHFLAGPAKKLTEKEG